jgi:hypothetical protein
VHVLGLDAVLEQQLDHVGVAVVEHLLEELGRPIEEVVEAFGVEERVQFLLRQFCMAAQVHLGCMV